MAAPKKKAAKTRVKRSERKNIAVGQAHIKSTFNNTIISITDPAGNVISWQSAGHGGLQGLAQVDAVRRADGRRGSARRTPRSTACARSPCS